MMTIPKNSSGINFFTCIFYKQDNFENNFPNRVITQVLHFYSSVTKRRLHRSGEIFRLLIFMPTFLSREVGGQIYIL